MHKPYQAPADSKYGIKIPMRPAPEGHGGPYPMRVFQADYCESLSF